MIQKGVFIFQIIKHIYPLKNWELTLQITSIARLSYSRKYFLNSLKFVPLLKVLIKRNSGKAKD